MEPFDVVVVGGANTDFLGRARSLPSSGQSVAGDVFQVAPGGKGANQAVAAARLGADVALIGCVGSDARGRTIVARLADENVDTRGVGRDLHQPTGAALIMIDGAGRRQTLWIAGANRAMTTRDVAATAGLIASARVVLLQLEVPLAVVEAAARLARAAGARVVLDAAPVEPLGEALLRDLHVLRCNAREAETLTGVHVADRRSGRRAAENLLHRGVGHVLVGEDDGDLLLSPDGELWLPHLPVTVVDTTGAGDAFTAAFAVALARGSGLAEAARFASAAAAVKVTKLGAQAGLPRSDEILNLLQGAAHVG